MWQIIGGLLVVGAVIFFIQGYPGRAFLLLSPFLLFGLLVAVLAFFQSAKRQAERRRRDEAEAADKARRDAHRRQEAADLKPLTDRLAQDIAVVEAAVARQKELVARKLAEARAAGAPTAKIDALTTCSSYLEIAFRVPDRERDLLPRLHFGMSSYYALPQKVVGQDWSQSLVYYAYRDSDLSDWPARHLSSAAGLVDLALGDFADQVRHHWPQLVDELELSGYSAANLVAR